MVRTRQTFKEPLFCSLRRPGHYLQKSSQLQDQTGLESLQEDQVLLQPSPPPGPGARRRMNQLRKLQGTSRNLLLFGLRCRREQGGLQGDLEEVSGGLHLLRSWNPGWKPTQGKEDWRKPLENFRRTQRLQGASRSLLPPRLRCRGEQGELQGDLKEACGYLHLLRSWNLG